MTKELSPTTNYPTRAPIPDPLDRLVELLGKGVQVEAIDKLLDVHHKHQKELARRAFIEAFARFKSEPIGKIVKKKTVTVKLKDKQTGQQAGSYTYKHETLAQVVAAVSEPMAKHGLVHSWTTTQDPATKQITVTCSLRHVDGHVESVSLFGLPDDSGQKNAIQQVRSTITFLQRSTLELITGTAAHDDDNDTHSDDRGRVERGAPAERGEPTLLSEKQAALLRKKLAAKRIAETEFEAGCGVPVDRVTFDGVNAALQWIEQQEARQ